MLNELQKSTCGAPAELLKDVIPLVDCECAVSHLGAAFICSAADICSSD